MQNEKRKKERNQWVGLLRNKISVSASIGIIQILNRIQSEVLNTYNSVALW